MSNEISDPIKEIMDDFINEIGDRSRRNYSRVATYANIPKSTLSKTLNGQRTPTIPEIISICISTNRKNRIPELIKYYHPNEVHIDGYINGISTSEQFTCEEFEDLLINRDYFDILSRLLCGSKLTRPMIKDERGQVGVDSLDNLITIGAVIENNGDLSLNKKMVTDPYQINPTLLPEIIKLACDYYKTESIGKNKNRIAFIQKRVGLEQRKNICSFLQCVRQIVWDMSNNKVPSNDLIDDMVKFTKVGQPNNDDEKNNLMPIFFAMILDDFLPSVKVDYQVNKGPLR